MQKKMFPLMIVLLILIIGLSWVIFCGIIKLITLCFGLTFSFKIATGIWLIAILINGFFINNNNRRN